MYSDYASGIAFLIKTNFNRMMKGLMPREPVCGALLAGCAFGILRNLLLMLLDMKEYSYRTNREVTLECSGRQ